MLLATNRMATLLDSCSMCSNIRGLQAAAGDPLKPLYDVGNALYDKAMSDTPIGLGAIVGAVLRVVAGGTADGYEGRVSALAA